MMFTYSIGMNFSTPSWLIQTFCHKTGMLYFDFCISWHVFIYEINHLNKGVCLRTQSLRLWWNTYIILTRLFISQEISLLVKVLYIFYSDLQNTTVFDSFMIFYYLIHFYCVLGIASSRVTLNPVPYDFLPISIIT